MVLLGEPCRKHHRFSDVLTYLNIIWQFCKVSIQNVWNISYGYNCKFFKRWRWKNILFLSLDIIWMKWYNYVYWARRLFILSCVSAENCRASASEREWWCRSVDKHRWTCVHRVWAPTNPAKRDWASCNRDKACCFRTNAAPEPPLDQSRSYCCCTWAQLSVSWRTTTVIPWKWKKDRHILWRSSAVLQLAVSRRFSSKNRQCVIVAIKNNYHIQLFIFFICLFFRFDFKDAIKYTAMLSKCLHFLWKPFFPRSDTCPTQVGDMDPRPVTWPNLSDLIGWGQKISPTSW